MQWSTGTRVRDAGMTLQNARRGGQDVPEALGFLHDWPCAMHQRREASQLAGSVGRDATFSFFIVKYAPCPTQDLNS